MGKKFRKIGQTDHYEEVKESGCGTIIGWAVVIIIILGLIGSCAEG